MEAKILFLLTTIVIMGIYLLPSAMARLAGSHTWELNSTDGAASLDCTDCHQYIFDELNATTKSREVLTAHRNAAGNSTFSSQLLNPKVTNTSDSKLCLMCHLAKISVSTMHTQIMVRPCIDISCHGSNESTNNTIYFEAGRMGVILGQTNVHESWFDQFSGFNSDFLNETGAAYSKGYFTCMGCHTQVGVQINRSGTEYFAHNTTSAFGGNARRYL